MPLVMLICVALLGSAIGEGWGAAVGILGVIAAIWLYTILSRPADKRLEEEKKRYQEGMDRLNSGCYCHRDGCAFDSQRRVALTPEQYVQSCFSPRTVD